MRRIIRVEHTKDKPYVLVNKEMLQDTNLDFQSKGLLCFLLTKPDDWQIRPDQLANELKEGQATIYRIIKKLIDGGYIHRELIRRRIENGQIQTASLYIVFENKDRRYEWIKRGKREYERSRRADSQL